MFCNQSQRCSGWAAHRFVIGDTCGHLIGAGAGWWRGGGGIIGAVDASIRERYKGAGFHASCVDGVLRSNGYPCLGGDILQIIDHGQIKIGPWSVDIGQIVVRTFGHDKIAVFFIIVLGGGRTFGDIPPSKRTV